MDKVDIRFRFLVIGSGGTGSLFLPTFTRMVFSSEEVIDKITCLLLIDGDTVEEKNLSRQNFVFDDIGSSKAITMADILNEGLIDQMSKNQFLSWVGKNEYITDAEQILYCFEDCFEGYDYAVSPNFILEIPVIIGCIDNDHCRMVCEEAFNALNNCFYYDAGNEFSSGEVVFSHKLNGKVISPLKSELFPVMKQEKLVPVTELSCEELNASHPQHLITNMGAAYLLLTAVANLLSANSADELMKAINMNCGYVTFDKDCHSCEFIRKEAENV